MHGWGHSQVDDLSQVCVSWVPCLLHPSLAWLGPLQGLKEALVPSWGLGVLPLPRPRLLQTSPAHSSS